MLNQQMIIKQNQTMSSFITRMDSLAKAINKSYPLVGIKRKAHELSDCEDITSDSDILMDSSSEEEAVGKERREMTKKGDSIESKDNSAAGTSDEKVQGRLLKRDTCVVIWNC